MVLPRQGSLLAEHAALVVAETHTNLEAHCKWSMVIDVPQHRLLVRGPIEATDVLVIPGTRHGLTRLLTLDLVRVRHHLGARAVPRGIARLHFITSRAVVLEKLRHSEWETTFAPLRVTIAREHALDTHLAWGFLFLRVRIARRASIMSRVANA